MMRRRALLAASQMGGGGKIVNHGVITGSGRRTILTWEYPVASYIAVIFSTNMGSIMANTLKDSDGCSIALGPIETLSSIVSITPQEDETYIYEVTL